MSKGELSNPPTLTRIPAEEGVRGCERRMGCKPPPHPGPATLLSSPAPCDTSEPPPEPAVSSAESPGDCPACHPLAKAT